MNSISKPSPPIRAVAIPELPDSLEIGAASVQVFPGIKNTSGRPKVQRIFGRQFAQELRRFPKNERIQQVTRLFLELPLEQVHMKRKKTLWFSGVHHLLVYIWNNIPVKIWRWVFVVLLQCFQIQWTSFFGYASWFQKLICSRYETVFALALI